MQEAVTLINVEGYTRIPVNLPEWFMTTNRPGGTSERLLPNKSATEPRVNATG